ncbi:PRKX (predicted) [Pycnogonum litorale]
MANNKISKEKLRKNGISVEYKEPPPDVIRRKEYSIDDFEILKTVGTGTFARVCLCKENKTKNYYAMKILEIQDVVKLKQVDHVLNEKDVLKRIQHPFIIDMIWTGHDDYRLYMLFEYACGGELFSYLRNAGHFPSTTANFYSAEIVSALEYIHKKNIVYRDLKPENLLLDRDGHVKITDFGFSKRLGVRTWTLCGTPEYLAPEIIQSKGHNKAVDWWALGILIYEMLAGYPPFYDEETFKIYEKILKGKIEWPKNMDPVAKDMVRKLLQHDRTKRLGNMKNGAEDVKSHRWYKTLDWDDVISRHLKPPMLPDVCHDGDSTNFDNYPEININDCGRPASEFQRDMFHDF